MGHAIVKVQDRWDRPFLVHFPRFPVSSPARLSQAEKENIGSYSLKQTVQELRSALNEAIRAVPESDRKEGKNQRISQQERNLLLDIAKHPLSVVTERSKRLGWSAHTGTKIKRRLLASELVNRRKLAYPMVV